MGQRPDPDQLLQAIERHSAEEKQGRLKVFLGMAPGVGKTYAMLRQAQDLKQKGVDVAVGIVETHGRSETMALLSGLEVLPRKSVEYRGITIEEFNLDLALARKPQLILMDELAHTNAPGERHKKRFQDVLELLDSGINVYTTLNIQHLESRSEIVREITGVKVQETLPDSFLDNADEIVLIDLDPEELLKRLREGKIYSPDKAEEAASHFFQVGHLTALRELALRTTTERVDQELQDIRRIHHVEKTWRAAERLMVAVFASPYSEKLIRRTRILASAMGAQWFGAFVETPRALSEDERTLLSKNLALVRELGGVVVTTMDENAAKGLLRMAHENNISQIVVGRSKQPWWNRLRNSTSLVEYLMRESQDIDVYVVTGDDTPSIRNSTAVRSHIQTPNFRDYGIVSVVLLLVSVLGMFALPNLGYRSVGILFLLAVAMLALFVRRSAVWYSALLSGLLWDFIFVPPSFALTLAQPEDYLLIIMFVATAAITGQLVAKLRRNQEILTIREHRASSLYSMARQILSAQSLDRVVEMTIHEVSQLLNSDVAVFLRRSQKIVEHPSGSLIVDDKERSVAHWVIEHNRPAGRFTDTLPSASALYIPLSTPNGTLGALGIKPRTESQWTPELQTLLDTIVQQLVSGIERELLHELERKNVMEEESDRLSRIILNTVSHEFETPVHALEQIAHGMSQKSQWTPEELGNLTASVGENSRRLRRLVDHLLEMSQLEAGELKLKKSRQDIRALISRTLQKMGPDLNSHKVKLQINQTLPDVLVDPGAVEQIVSNIFDNFVMHTPPGSWLEVGAFIDNNSVVLTFRDNGPGLPQKDPSAVFGKFFRGAGETGSGGSGLGLSIAKGLVEAHGGTITAQNCAEGGAEFILRLPLDRA